MDRRKGKEKSMSTLYEITGEYLQLLEWLEEEDSLEEQVIRDTIGAIEGELETKADNYAKIMKELAACSDKFDKEIQRLTARKAAYDSRHKILRDSLYNAMKLTGKLKFKTDLFSFGIQKNGGLQPMELVEGAAVPDEYLKKEPDNGKIREALKEGKVLPFVILKERGEHLKIR